MLSVDWLSMEPFSFDESKTESWLTKVVLTEGFDLGEIALVFCTDDELLEMNIKHLNHDYLTDIITFDYTENKMVSGDLFISVDRVKDNGMCLGVEFVEELNRVVVHGVLHLIGYGDKSDEDAITMRSKEDFYLNIL